MMKRLVLYLLVVAGLCVYRDTWLRVVGPMYHGWIQSFLWGAEHLRLPWGRGL